MVDLPSGHGVDGRYLSDTTVAMGPVYAIQHPGKQRICDNCRVAGKPQTYGLKVFLSVGICHAGPFGVFKKIMGGSSTTGR